MIKFFILLMTISLTVPVHAQTKKVHNINNRWNPCEIIVMGSVYAVYKLNAKMVNVALNLTSGEESLVYSQKQQEIFIEISKSRNLTKLSLLRNSLTNDKR